MHLTKAKKAIAGFCALTLALTAAPFTDGSPISLLAAAASSESGAGTAYDFRDGSIIPTNTDGKSDITKGDITIKVGTKNAYAYNDAQHGVQFKAGNSIEIKVDGPTKLTVGDCLYSNATELTVKSADGSYTETKSVKAGCYHNDGSAAVFKYTGEAAATLVIEFTAGTYVPVIIAEPIDNTPDKNGVPKDSVYMYNFSDGSIVPDETIGQVVDKTVSSKDGFLTINSNGNVSFGSNQHGVIVKNGASPCKIRLGRSIFHL